MKKDFAIFQKDLTVLGAPSQKPHRYCPLLGSTELPGQQGPCRIPSLGTKQNENFSTGTSSQAAKADILLGGLYLARTAHMPQDHFPSVSSFNPARLL